MCQSCKEDISSKFTHAISVNVCPMCGNAIMNEKLQNVLGELKVAFDDAKDYMSEVEDWLFSNFSLKKIGSDEVVINKDKLLELDQQPKIGRNTNMIMTKGKPGIMVNRSDDEDVSINETNDAASTTVFAKRAGVPSHKKTLDFIKGKASFSGAADPSEFPLDEEEGFSETIEQNPNPLNVKEINQMVDLFGTDEPTQSRELDMQKLKKLQSQSALGGGGAFRRG